MPIRSGTAHASAVEDRAGTLLLFKPRLRIPSEARTHILYTETLTTREPYKLTWTIKVVSRTSVRIVIVARLVAATWDVRTRRSLVVRATRTEATKTFTSQVFMSDRALPGVDLRRSLGSGAIYFETTWL